MISPQAVHIGPQRLGTDADPTSVRKAPQEALPSTSNAEKLRTLCNVVGLRPVDVARAAGASKGLVSMILHGQREGSPEFWFSVEQRLGQLVAERRTAVFTTGRP